MPATMMPLPDLFTFLRDCAKTSLTDATDSPPPTLTIEREVDGEMRLEVVVMAIDGHPFDALGASAEKLAEGGPIRRISLTNDTYMWTGKAEDGHPGNIADRLAEGDPRATEALIVLVASWGDFNVSQLAMTYRRIDGELVWTDEKEREGAQVTGRIPAALQTIMLLSHG